MAADVARTLFAVVIALSNQGRAVNILMDVERHNGCAVGWSLKREYETRLPGRYANTYAADGSNCVADVFAREVSGMGRRWSALRYAIG